MERDLLKKFCIVWASGGGRRGGAPPFNGPSAPWAAYGILTGLGASAADCFYAVVGAFGWMDMDLGFFDTAAGSHPYRRQKLCAVAGNPPVYLRAGENAVSHIKRGD